MSKKKRTDLCGIFFAYRKSDEAKFSDGGFENINSKEDLEAALKAFEKDVPYKQYFVEACVTSHDGTTKEQRAWFEELDIALDVMQGDER